MVVVVVGRGGAATRLAFLGSAPEEDEREVGRGGREVGLKGPWWEAVFGRGGGGGGWDLVEEEREEVDSEALIPPFD